MKPCKENGSNLLINRNNSKRILIASNAGILLKLDPKKGGQITSIYLFEGPGSTIGARYMDM